MVISIKSEMDSRPLLYTLIGTLRAYGTVCLISSNPIIQRLIEDEDNGGMRNVRVIFDADGAVDSVYEEHGITLSDYDYILLDNMGVIEYDMLMVTVGETLSESFQEDINMLKKDDNSRFIQFGKGARVGSKSGRASRSSSSNSSGRRRNRRSSSDDEFDVDPGPESKYVMDEDEEEQYKVSERWYSGCEYPTWEEVEQMESKYRFPTVGNKLAAAYYDIFKIIFNIDRRSYEKRMRASDRTLTGKSRSRIIE